MATSPSSLLRLTAGLLLAGGSLFFFPAQAADVVPPSVSADRAPSSSSEAIPPLVVSISPFPYDKTAEAVQTIGRIIREHANLYTVQLDNGIPWEEALDGKPFDRKIMEQWEPHKKSIGTNPVYLAIAPLAEDRTSWTAGFEGKKAPAWARDEKHATDQLKRAYTLYVLRAVDYFRPAYLNLGVEAGDMAAKLPQKWPLYEALFTHCTAEVKAKHPSLKLGISFGLPLLMKAGVLDRARKVIDQSDYIGISFYPYLSEFYAKLGASPLPAPPKQWRESLDWLKRNVKKPVAICETAYSTEPIALPRHGIKMAGDKKLQSDYITDLATIARRDHYLFTVFFLAIDCESLMKDLPAGDGSSMLWTYTGFFDKNLKEKPAWTAYQRAWLGRQNPPPTVLSAAPPPPPPGTASANAFPDAVLAFNSSSDLFSAPAPDQVSLVQTSGKPASMRWKYAFKKGEFFWSVKAVPAGSASATTGLAFDLKSDRQNPLLIQVEESSGETFFCVLQPGKEWATQELPWSKFQPDPKNKKKNGKLEQDQIVRLMLADGTAVDQKITGDRTVEVSNLHYLRRK